MSFNVEGLSAAKEQLIADLRQRLQCAVVCIQETHRGPDAIRPSIPGMDLAIERPHSQYGSAIFVTSGNIVNTFVFKTYCSCLYTAQLWGTCLSRTMNRLKVAYNDSLRMVLGIPRYCSASEMFAYTNVPSCQCVIRLNIYSFMRRIQCTNNIIVRSIVNSDLIFSSLLWRNWRQRLFYIPNS